MKHIAFRVLTILLILSPTLQAQDSYQDVIYLKNGSVFRGMIFEIVPEKSITIEADNHFVYTVTFEQIEKIRKEPKRLIAVSSSGLSSSSDFISPPRSYTNILQCGMLTWRLQPLATFGLVHSVPVGDRWAFGPGVGWDTYGNGTMLPVFIDARTYLIPGQTSLFVFADAGYALGLIRQRNVLDAGGFSLNAGAGLSVPSLVGATFVAQVFYRLQKSTDIETGVNSTYNPYSYSYYPYENKVRVTREFVGFTIGVGF